jgi:hypothetical protein
MNEFTPSAHWQDIPKGHVFTEHGLEYRFNLETGRPQVRRPPNGNGAHEPDFEMAYVGASGTASSGWPDPVPLFAEHEKPAPYPVDALPAAIRPAVESYQAFGQQPIEMVACSALAAASLACQGLANADRDGSCVSAARARASRWQ